MDDSAFDKLIRSFAVPSRRAVLSALGAALVPALIAHDGAEDALAKPKHRGNRGREAASVRASGKKKKKKKKKKKGGRGREPVCTEGLGSEAACDQPTCTATGYSCVGDSLGCCGCCSERGCRNGTTPDACGPAGGICDMCVDRPGMICENRRCCIPNYLPCSGDSSPCCDNASCVGSSAEQRVCCPRGRDCQSNARGVECCEPGQHCYFDTGCGCGEGEGEAECKALQGCCQDGHCAPGFHDNACGIDGKACKNCLPDGTCVNGQCQGTCLSNGTTCPSGCDPDGDSCSDCCGGACDRGICCVPFFAPCPEGCPANGPCPGCCPEGCENGKCALGCLDGREFCAQTSDGRTNECLWTDGINCRLPEGNIAFCSTSIHDGCCTNTGDGSPCRSTEFGCRPGEPDAEPVTCPD